MRKSVCIFLVLFLTVYSIPAFAYNYPNDFWTINSKYEAALNSNNYADRRENTIRI